MSKKQAATSEREREILAALSLHLSDDEVIEITEQADQEDDRLAYLETEYAKLQEQEHAAGKELDLLTKHNVRTQEMTRTLTNRRTREEQTTSVGWLIVQQRNGADWYTDRTHGFTVNWGMLTPFATEDEARQSALQYVATIEAASRQFHHVPRQILLKIPVCPSVPKPEKGAMLQLHLDVDMAHALAMIREGCLASNTLGPSRQAVDTNPNVIRKLLYDLINTVAPTRHKII